MPTSSRPGAARAFERPLVTVDVVIFTVAAARLQVLLVQRPEARDEPFPGRMALPGGFVDVAQDRTLLHCARRKLKEKTGVSTPYLEQLGSWGGAERDPRGWAATHAYFALLPFESVLLRDGGQGGARWFAVEDAVKLRLAFDHRDILQAAVDRLRGKVEYTSLPAFLLAEPFTLPQLQQAYETVLDRKLDKSAFRKRMLDADFLEDAGPVTSGRVAQGYRIADRRTAAIFPRTFKSAE